MFQYFYLVFESVIYKQSLRDKGEGFWGMELWFTSASNAASRKEAASLPPCDGLLDPISSSPTLPSTVWPPHSHPVTASGRAPGRSREIGRQAHVHTCTLECGGAEAISTLAGIHMACWAGGWLTGRASCSSLPVSSWVWHGGWMPLGSPPCSKAEQMATGRSYAWLELAEPPGSFLVQRLEWGGSRLSGPHVAGCGMRCCGLWGCALTLWTSLCPRVCDIGQQI